MLFYFIRHADPVYDPDSLTPLGKRQAEALAKRLAMHGIDKIYSSTSNRAVMTAKPTCELLKKDMETLDFALESHAWREFTVERNGKRMWIFHDPEIKKILEDPAVAELGHKWYEYPGLGEYRAGIERVYKDAFDFFKTLGYEHIGNSGMYKIEKQNNERVAFFAHQGFGLAFLSVILGIPYPTFVTRFDLSHSSMTVINFSEEDGISMPKVLTLSSDSHIYREGLPTKYNNGIYI